MSQPYELPQIKRYANNDWCIEYKYLVPEDWPEYPSMKRFKVREGINYIKDLAAKEAEAESIRKNIEFALTKKDYNPFLDRRIVIQEIKKERAKQDQQAREEEKTIAITDALQYVIEQKTKQGLSEPTIAALEYTIKWFKLWIQERNEDSNEPVKLTSIDQITTAVIERYLEEQQDDTGWSPRTYNNHLSNLVTIFRYLVKKKKLLIDPLPPGAIDKKSTRAEKNKYYPKSIRKIILPEIKKKPYLETFVNWVYYSCARVKELCNLKVEHIDLDLRKIRIPSTVGKTGGHVGDRTVPICEELYDIIKKMGIHKYPHNYYVFTRDLKPGLVPVPRDYFRDLYLPIKRAKEIDPNYTLYSFKHTRVVDLLAEGWPAQKVMFQTGHTDWTSFMKYCRELGAVIDEQLKGKTINLSA